MFDRKTGFESLNCKNPYTIIGPDTGMAGGAAAPPPRFLLPCIFPELKKIVLK